MILILNEKPGTSVNKVVDWFKCDYAIINEDDQITSLTSKIGLENYILSIELTSNLTIDITKVRAFWYFGNDFNLDYFTEHHIFSNQLFFEWDKLKDLLNYFVSQNRYIGSFYKETKHNKILSLINAHSLGLRIPLTLISTQKYQLIDFHKLYKNSITKAIDNMFEFTRSSFFQKIGTKPILDENMTTLNNSFFPTLVQERIKKSFELRIYYMKGAFYPMAIFSQNDEKTQLDYRNYNREKPNRNIPYILPKDIEEKLQKLMDKLDLDTGSIDMIVTPEGKYVFLEVNPTGQFGWVSENCNYYLEEKIANYLQYES